MQGTKATWLEEKCKSKGWQYTRFDYRAHGQSEGSTTSSTLHDWLADTLLVLDTICIGPQILVGSSMGGWLATLAAAHRSDKVCGLLGVAAAPDFTEELIAAQLDDETRALLDQGEIWQMKSNYETGFYPITGSLLDSGRALSVLGGPIDIHCPVRLLHGTADTDVPESLSRRLLARLASKDVRLTLVKDADHRFSSPCQLELIFSTLLDLHERAQALTRHEQHLDKSCE